LPTPEGKRDQRPTKQLGLAGALHHVVAGSEQAATAKGKNHRIGVQWAQAAIAQPWNTKIKLGPCELGGDEHADQHADHPPDDRHDRELAHDGIVVVRNFCL
jgi:hypothetical protein